jgi:cyclopropane-fatty-acyl-phospholipid synthase
LVSQEGANSVIVKVQNAQAAAVVSSVDSSDSPVKPAWYETFVDREMVPDVVLRAGIRRLLRDRLREEDRGSAERNQARKNEFVEELKASPIALSTQAANEQHYEVPTAFFQAALGQRLKYSSGYWPSGVTNLDEAEVAMLKLTCERAQLQDGQRVLELGCGWGSLSLFMAERYPKSTILGVSNSRTQRAYIEGESAGRGLQNLRIITADMNDFQTGDCFDRVLSVEMFEHMRNYETLLARVASWLRDDGLLFVHVFAHARFAYPFQVKDASDWMAEHFFSGGIMPSDDLFSHFSRDMGIQEQWRLEGTHYQKTAEAWLANMDLHRGTIMPLFAKTYGAENAVKWWVRWRIFFMACAELWGYGNGSEWGVSHYLFRGISART